MIFKICLPAGGKHVFSVNALQWVVKEKFSVLNLGPGGLVEKGTLESGIEERCLEGTEDQIWSLLSLAAPPVLDSWLSHTLD